MDTLLGKTLNDLEALVSAHNLPRFVAKQLADWLYAKRVTTWDEMRNISKETKAKLSEHYTIGQLKYQNFAQSIDGTKKYLFKANQGYIESAFIPEADRATLCISSQVGCKMNCKFCATGLQGFQANLTTAEIINQIFSIDETAKLTNLVFMGMGEPLDNLDNVLKAIEIITSKWGIAFSPRRITLSTAGVLTNIDKFMQNCDAHLAISLHNAISEERAQIMPIEHAYPIKQVVDQLRKYDWSGQRRLSFEYTLLSGKNDTPQHIKALTQLLNGLNCRINLIQYNSIQNDNFVSTGNVAMENFRQALVSRGFTATIRHSKGADINAACGLLSTKALQHETTN